MLNREQLEGSIRVLELRKRILETLLSDSGELGSRVHFEEVLSTTIELLEARRKELLSLLGRSPRFSLPQLVPSSSVAIAPSVAGAIESLER